MTISKPVTLEEALDIAQERAYHKRTPAFPPVGDTITWFQHVDWQGRPSALPFWHQ